MTRTLIASLIGLLAASAVATAAEEAGSAARGRTYAERACASCHAILPNAELSPDPDAAPFQVIADTPGMTHTALSVWLRTTHKAMPNLIIEPEDRDDVIAYITGLKRKATPRQESAR